MRVVAGQHADLTPGRLGHLGTGRDHPVGQPGQLVVVRLVHDRGHLAGSGTGLGLQRQQLRPAGVELGGQVVGGGQDPLVGAAVDGEGVRRGPAVTGREARRELEDVGDRGTAPAVDRLVGVTDRGDRVPEAALGIRPREQSAQHQRLGDRGVLVLVEEDHLELAALDLAHLGTGLRQPGGERDLVGEVHQAEVRLEPAVGLDQADQLGPLVDRRDRLLVLLAVGLAVLGRHPVDEPRPLAGVVGQHRRGVDEVLAHLGVEGEEVLDDVAGRVGELVDGGRVALHGAGGELVAAGVGDQPGVGLVADPQAVLGEERRGVGVVRRHRRLLDLLLVVADPGSPLGQQPGLAEVVADPGLELGGGLGGEGEAEDLARCHPAGATSQTTRAAITVVLPEPAPAMTTAGSSGAVTAAHCCGLNVQSSPRSAASCSGVSRVWVTTAPTRPPCRGRSP